MVTWNYTLRLAKAILGFSCKSSCFRFLSVTTHQPYYTPGYRAFTGYVRISIHGKYFSLTLILQAIDARGSLQTLDQYFEFLQESIRDNLISVDGLPWGTETQRLPPPMIEAFDQPKITS